MWLEGMHNIVHTLHPRQNGYLLKRLNKTLRGVIKYIKIYEINHFIETKIKTRKMVVRITIIKNQNKNTPITKDSNT